MNRVVVDRKKLKTDRLGALQQWFTEIESMTNGKESLKNTEVDMPVIEDFKNWDALEEALQLIHKGYSLTDEASLPVKFGRGQKVPVAIDWARTINSQHNGSVQDWADAYNESEHEGTDISVIHYYDWMYQVYNYDLVDPRDLPTLNHENVHLLSQEAKLVAEVADDWENPTVYEVQPIFFIKPYYSMWRKMRNDSGLAKKVGNQRNYLKNEWCDSYTSYERNAIRDEVLTNIKKALLTGKRKVVATIPSSTVGKTSVIQDIIMELAHDFPNEIIDGSQLIVRTLQKPSSHGLKHLEEDSPVQKVQQYKDANSIRNNMGTMSINKKILEGISPETDIVIFDDFVTSGSSFVAVNQMLNQELPDWQYTNLAYGKTIKGQTNETWEQHAAVLEGRIEAPVSDGPILGAIFDLDNTIIDTDRYYKDFGKFVFYYGGRDKKILKTKIELPFNTGVDFDHVNLELLKLKEFIQTSVVTNRDWNNTKVSIKSQLVYKNLFNVGQYETKEGNNKNILFYQDSEWVMTGAKKPDITTLNKMVEKIRDGKQGRIIGFGNQESDILAYRAAGVEPYLVTVYNKVAFNNTFGLDDDHVLDSEEKIRGLVDQLRQTHQAESENVKMDELDVYEFDPDFDIMEPEF